MTDKQRRFVEEYCVDFNATQAAIRAGYSEKTAYSQGARLLKNVEIQAAIEARLEELAMSAAEATKRLGDIARADVADCFVVRELTHEDDNRIPPGETRRVAELDLAALVERGPSRLVKSITYTKHGPRVEMYNALEAQKTILQMHGRMKQQLEMEGEIRVTVAYEDHPD